MSGNAAAPHTSQPCPLWAGYSRRSRRSDQQPCPMGPPFVTFAKTLIQNGAQGVPATKQPRNFPLPAFALIFAGCRLLPISLPCPCGPIVWCSAPGLGSTVGISQPAAPMRSKRWRNTGRSGAAGWRCGGSGAVIRWAVMGMIRCLTGLTSLIAAKIPTSERFGCQPVHGWCTHGARISPPLFLQMW